MAARRLTVAIARPASAWERRAPLVPEAVRAMVARGVEVLVAPSSARAFSDAEYAVAGATITDDHAGAAPDLVLTVSPPEPGSLLPDTTYATFSHTRKAPATCAGLLAEAAEKRVRLLDYELLTEGGVRGAPRLVSFSRSGGHVGMINTFGGLGSHLLSQGYTTPFLNAPQAWMLESLWEARARVFAMGEAIARHGVPAPIGPLVFAFMGDGNVSRGARDVFELLPHEYVAPADLPALLKAPPSDASHKVFGVVVRRSDALQHVAGHGAVGATGGDLDQHGGGGASSFDEAKYLEDPRAFSTAPFATGVAPHASVLVNALDWDARYPRWLTAAQLRANAGSGGSGSRLLMVSDLSCDPHGAVDLGAGRLSTSSAPYFSADPTTSLAYEDVDGSRTTVMAVPALAQQIPREASEAFSAQLAPLLPGMLAMASGEHEGAELRAAEVTTASGALSKGFEYIEAALASRERANGNGKGTGGGATVCLSGHLFDSGLINRALDLLEQEQPEFNIRGFDGNDDGTTSCTFELGACSDAAADATIAKLEKLSGAIITAQATLTMRR